MMLVALVVWLGVGLFVLARPERASRVCAFAVGTSASWLLRAGGAAALSFAVCRLAGTMGLALASVAVLLCAMAAKSLAVLLFSFAPRLYGGSVVAAAVGAAGALAFG